jgi:hypothetical protein
VTVSRPPRSVAVSERSSRSPDDPDCLSHGGSQGFKSPHLHPTNVLVTGLADRFRWAGAVPGPLAGQQTGSNRDQKRSTAVANWSDQTPAGAPNLRPADYESPHRRAAGRAQCRPRTSSAVHGPASAPWSGHVAPGGMANRMTTMLQRRPPDLRAAVIVCRMVPGPRPGLPAGGDSEQQTAFERPCTRAVRPSTAPGHAAWRRRLP